MAFSGSSSRGRVKFGVNRPERRLEGVSSCVSAGSHIGRCIGEILYCTNIVYKGKGSDCRTFVD